MRWTRQRRRRGDSGPSGPFIEEGVLVGDGLTILSTSTIDEARQAMQDEPLIKRGLRTFELRKWELREGGSISRCTRPSASIRFDVSRALKNPSSATNTGPSLLACDLDRS
jgi:hypothetical protein